MKIKKIKFIFLFIFVCLCFFHFTNPIKAQKLIDINTASLEELDTLPGIGDSKAQAIIDYRQTNGDFKKIDDITNVSGIGQTTFDKFKNLITVSDSTTTNTPKTNNVVINEVLPNPEGSDDAEWIELKNLSNSEVNLENWQIADSSKSYTFPNLSIPNNGFYILKKTETGISLNNSGGEKITLKNSKNEIISETNYTEKAIENSSWSRKPDGTYTWTDNLTKNSENIFNNTAPDTEKTSPPTSLPTAPKKHTSIYQGKIIISEIMPNPTGIDTGFTEWIEIANLSHQKIYLNHWKLKTNQTQYDFDIQKIEPYSFLILRRQNTHLNLKNINGDSLTLFDSHDQIVDSVNYSTDAPEKQSYNWCVDYKKWMWLEKTSLGTNNNCPPINTPPVAYFESSTQETYPQEKIFLSAQESYDPDGTIEKYIWKFDEKILESTSTSMTISFDSPGQHKIILTTLDNLSGEDSFSFPINVLGQHQDNNSPPTSTPPQNNKKDNSATKNNTNNDIEFEGQVLVEPGVLGSTFFYIANQSFGFQIYCQSKNFPPLTLGDTIHVVGVFSEYYNQSRIKIKNSDNIKIIESGNIPIPLNITLNKNFEIYEGMLVKVSGTIVDKEYDNFWLSSDTGEIKITIKPTTGIDKNFINIGDKINITGIISQTKTGYQLLPRYARDIQQQAILGRKTSNPNKETNTFNNLNKYLLTTLIAIILIFIIVLIKKRN